MGDLVALALCSLPIGVVIGAACVVVRRAVRPETSAMRVLVAATAGALNRSGQALLDGGKLSLTQLGRHRAGAELLVSVADGFAGRMPARACSSASWPPLRRGSRSDLGGRRLSDASRQQTADALA